LLLNDKYHVCFSKVELAVPALLKYLEKTRSKEMNLLNENELIWLQLALKKIPEPDKQPKRMWVD
jgi:hypothetical protein